jgi:hypothetical protein
MMKLLFVMLLGMLPACAIVNAVRQPKPIRVACPLSTLDKDDLVKAALFKHGWVLTRSSMADGIYTAYRSPGGVYYGDQVMFNGKLHLTATVDSLAITFLIYKAMDAETDKPKFEESYDEKAPLYILPFFKPMLDEIRHVCDGKR